MNFDIVCFDCDSTLSKIEGIDELARRIGLGEQMAELTNAAMNGEVALESVYARRLALIQPDQEAIDWVADLYIDQITPGAREAVEALQSRGASVHIISGGLRQAILPLAAYLQVPETNVHAVDVFFHPDGRYRDFDVNSALAKTGGKAQICREINPGKLSMALVGDGQTDLEAKQAGAKVIGFGGVVVRAAVESGADYYSKQPSLLSVLEFIS